MQRQRKMNISRWLYVLSVVITVLLALTAIIAAGANQVSPADSIFMAWLSMLAPVLLALNVVFALYWIVRWRMWMWVSIVAVCCQFHFVGHMIQFPRMTYTPTLQAHRLNIMTYNISQFEQDSTGRAQRALAHLMYTEGVDVVCLQEFEEVGHYNMDSLRRIFSGWEYAIVPKPDNDRLILQVAVFSRYPIVDHQLIVYAGSTNCSAWFDVDCEGHTIRVFNNHLQTTSLNQHVHQLKDVIHSSSQSTSKIGMLRQTIKRMEHNARIRAAQADSIYQLVSQSPHPVVVCGDMNSLPTSYVYRRMKGRLQDAFRTAGSGLARTYRNYGGWMRIDYIFHSRMFRCIKHYVHEGQLHSDHNPVIAQLEW